MIEPAAELEGVERKHPSVAGMRTEHGKWNSSRERERLDEIPL
jgi:hypothetical protein